MILPRLSHFLQNTRLVFSAVFLICVSVLAAALFIQHVIGLMPCALCIVQRVFFALTGISCLIGAIHNPKSTRATISYVVISILFIAAGIAAAVRQLYLQTLPLDKLPQCLPNLDYMLEVLPVIDIAKMFFYGTAECAKLDWTLLGIGIPEWSFITYTGLFLLLITFSIIHIKTKLTNL